MAYRWLTGLILALANGPALAQGQAQEIEPEFSIWDVQLGQPVTQIPYAEIGILACGTNGGPPAQPLAQAEDIATCPPEPSGLRELLFTYDDEQDFIARALEVEYQVFRGGTSVFAQPVIVSVLADDAGVVQGIRIVTDDRVSDNDRRNAVTLARNFKARLSDWALDCTDLPMQEGEQPAGNQFVHELCTGAAPDGTGTQVRVESTYLRKKGQEGRNRETQQVNTGYFESQTRFEMTLPPYSPSVKP